MLNPLSLSTEIQTATLISPEAKINKIKLLSGLTVITKSIPYMHLLGDPVIGSTLGPQTNQACLAPTNASEHLCVNNAE